MQSSAEMKHNDAKQRIPSCPWVLQTQKINVSLADNQITLLSSIDMQSRFELGERNTTLLTSWLAMRA